MLCLQHFIETNCVSNDKVILLGSADHKTDGATQ